MPHRQASVTRTNNMPRIWLMTDPRFGDGLIAAIQKLPMGSGVVFRHYALDDAARSLLYHAVRRVCRRRGHRLLIAGTLPLHWDNDGRHNSFRSTKSGLRSASVHNQRELKWALRASSDILFISPVRSTHSHPGGRVLGSHGLRQLSMIARSHSDVTIIALGGMNKAYAHMHRRTFIDGYAAIDAFVI